VNQLIDYRIHVVPVVPGTKKTMNLSGDAFAIESGHNPSIVIARDEAEPDPDRDPRADERRFHLGKFKKLRFDFTRLNTSFSYPPMRVLVCTDPRMGTVQTRVDPFDGREFRMVRAFTNGTTLPANPTETTLLATDALPSYTSFVEGLTGFSSDVYPSGAVRADVDFFLKMAVVVGSTPVPVAFQRGRVDPFTPTDFFCSLDFGWQTPQQFLAQPAIVALTHITGTRIPLPAAPTLITIVAVAGAGTFGARVSTVSK
jgi:hypothetical protein